MIAPALALVCIAAATEGLPMTLGWETDPAGWETRATEGAVLEATGAEGRPLLRIAVPERAPVGWPAFFRAVEARPGDLLELRVRARGEGTRDGYGAYAAIEHVGPDGTRISYTQSEAVPADVTGWVPLVLRSVMPEGIAQANVVLLLNGHGEAWFDEVLLARSRVPGPEPLAGPVTLTVSEDAVCSRFYGFGVEDDGWFYSDINRAHGITEDDIALREARVAWMDPDWVRMFFWYKDWCSSGDWETFTFDSDNMRSHERTLALYRRIGARVNVVGVEWGIDRPYAEPDKAAAAIGALLEHLVRKRGFDHIAAWTLSNEPNHGFLRDGSSFADFVRLHRLVRDEIARRGLDIQVVGSDDAQSLGWFRRCADDPDYREAVDLWSSHRYFLEADRFLVPGFFDDRMAILQERNLNQPFLMAELGFQDARSTHLANPVMETYPYALWIASLCIEGLNRGVAGFSIWCLHEVYYPGEGFMNYGLWNYKDRGWAVRPVYHAWSLFCRHTESGQPVYRCTSSHPGRVAAARVGDTLFWVNAADATAGVRIVGFDGGDVRIYTEDTLAGDRECGTLHTLDENTFTVPPRSFGVVRKR